MACSLLPVTNYFFLLFLPAADLAFGGAAVLPFGPTDFLEGEWAFAEALPVFFLCAAARFLAPLPDATTWAFGFSAPAMLFSFAEIFSSVPSATSCAAAAAVSAALMCCAVFRRAMSFRSTLIFIGFSSWPVAFWRRSVKRDCVHSFALAAFSSGVQSSMAWIFIVTSPSPGTCARRIGS